MNDFTIFLFGIMFAATASATFAFMWRLTGSVLEDVKKPKRNRHPEMQDVSDGEELLIFKELEDPEDK